MYSRQIRKKDQRVERQELRNIQKKEKNVKLKIVKYKFKKKFISYFD